MTLSIRTAMLLAFGPIIVLTSAIPTHVDKRSISYQMTCDAARNPDWADCKKVYNHMNKITKKNGDYMWPIWHSTLFSAIDIINSDCTPSDAGGDAVNNGGSMGVSIYSSGKSSSKVFLREEAATNNAAPVIQSRGGSSWTTAFTIENSAPSKYRQQVLDAQPGGSQWTFTNSQTQSNKVEASASVNADLFEIFSVSASISTTWEQIFTTTTEQTIVNHCKEDQTGTLNWYPRFTHYHGGFSPNGPAPVDIYVPQSNGKTAIGEYRSSALLERGCRSICCWARLNDHLPN
ncbi:hypothetical protein LTR95_006305 [Oleoguttula sp. CCFEE 5521]